MAEDMPGHAKIFLLPDGHFRCSCGAVVRMDVRGYAACEGCLAIHNDVARPVSNRERKRRLEKYIYDCKLRDE